MKSFIVIVAASFLCASAANAKPFASCHDEVGQVYYPHAGVVPANKAGWTKDAITGGKVTLDVGKDDKLDVLFLDSTGAISSARGGGADVILTALSVENISVLVAYPENTTELYDFFRDTGGKLQFTHLVSKPASVAVPKAGVYVGKCDYINFSAMK